MFSPLRVDWLLCLFVSRIMQLLLDRFLLNLVGKRGKCPKKIPLKLSVDLDEGVDRGILTPGVFWALAEVCAPLSAILAVAVFVYQCHIYLSC